MWLDSQYFFLINNGLIITSPFAINLAQKETVVDISVTVQSQKTYVKIKCFARQYSGIINATPTDIKQHLLFAKTTVKPDIWLCCIIFCDKMKWNESGFTPLLCTYRVNWARRTSWGWWDEWDDTALQTQDSKFKPCRYEAEHATSQSHRLLIILSLYDWMGKIFFFFKQPRPGNEPRTPAWKAAVLTTTLGWLILINFYTNTLSLNSKKNLCLLLTFLLFDLKQFYACYIKALRWVAMINE